MTQKLHSAPVNEAAALPDRARTAIELLEAVRDDRALLAALPEAEHVRLLQAVALVHHPEPRERRKKNKEALRDAARERARKAEALIDQTGIRTLRRKPVFTTPNYFPPHPAGQHDPHNKAAEPVILGESPELLHCYVCKQKFTQVH